MVAIMSKTTQNFTIKNVDIQMDSELEWLVI